MAENDIKIPKLFYLYHGTGTREYGFDNKLDDFDCILVPGPYHRDRLVNDKVCNEKKITIKPETHLNSFEPFKNDWPINDAVAPRVIKIKENPNENKIVLIKTFR